MLNKINESDEKTIETLTLGTIDVKIIKTHFLEYFQEFIK
jgi:hypothetical protein